MLILLQIIHVLVCLFLVVVVLLQSGKAADLAGAFGGIGSQTAFGPRGAATVLSKATTIAAIVFMLSSLSLAVLATRNAGTGSSVLERQAGKTATKKGQTPAAAAPAPAQPKGQPRVELIPEGSDTPIKTIPLDQLPRVNPATGQVEAPAQQPAPAKK